MLLQTKLFFCGCIAFYPIMCYTLKRKAEVSSVQDKMIFVLVFTGTWCLVGVVFLAVGGMLACLHRRKQRLCSERVWGQVVDILPVYGKEGGMTLAPLVEYATPLGMMRQRSAVSSGNCPYAVGQTVAVWYDPAQPSRWYLEGEKVSRMLSRIFLGVGAGAVLLGVAVGVSVVLFA